MSEQALNNLGVPHTRFTALCLAAIIIICLIPVIIDTGRRGPEQQMEGLALLTAQETWQRQHHGEANAWLNPTRNGRPRIRKPPLFVWSCLAAWVDLDPETSSVEQRIHRARLVSAAMSSVLLLATFWIGRTLGSTRLGLLASGVAGTLLLVQMQGRLANYDIHLAAWITLSVAAALRAIIPASDNHTATRLFGLWTAATIALACAIMIKGPVGLLAWAIPVLGATVIFRQWKVGVLGTLGCIIGAALLVAPWYLYLMSAHENAIDILLHEYGAELTNDHPWHYYPLRIIKLSFPWTLWLIGGLCLPFVAGSGALRTQRLIPFLWLVGYVVIFSINEGKSERYLTPAAPALALLIAFAWYDHHLLADRNEFDPRSRLVTWPHWAMLLVISIGVAPFFVMHDRFVGAFIDSPMVAQINWPLALIASAAMLVAVFLGSRWQLQWKPLRAAFATFAFAITLTILGWYGQTRTIDPNTVIAESARVLSAELEGKELRYLSLVETDLPDYEFLLYFQRPIPAVSETRLTRIVADHPQRSLTVLSSPQPEYHDIMRSLGFEFVREFDETSKRRRVLWERATK